MHEHPKYSMARVYAILCGFLNSFYFHFFLFFARALFMNYLPAFVLLSGCTM